MLQNKNLFSSEGVTRSDRILHTPSTFARQNLLYLQEAGRLKSLTPHRCVRENLDSFLFLAVRSGSGELSVGGTEYKIKRGDCALINCREHYEHISSEEDAWELAWVHFNGKSAPAYYELFHKYNRGGNIIHDSDLSAWNQLIGSIMEKQGDKTMMAELECGELLLHLLNALIGAVVDAEAAAGEAKNRQMNEVREYLNEEYADSRVMEAVHEKFKTGIQDMEQRFRNFYGITIPEYVENRRLNAAKELLRFTIKPVDEVARSSGIMDVALMQKLFRENENLSAEEYRMKWAQWIK